MDGCSHVIWQEQLMDVQTQAKQSTAHTKLNTLMLGWEHG
jgi:hypothetical protein